MNKLCAVVNPGLGGIKENIPTILLSDIYTPGDPTVNVVFENGYLRKIKGRMSAFDTIPDNEYINMLSSFQQTTGQRFFIAGTKSKIYYWNTDTWKDITGTATFTGEDKDYWSFTQYGNYFIFTNGVDEIFYWDGTGDIQQLGGSPPIAKFITNFKNYLIAGRLEDNPHKIAWSSIGEINNWTTGDSGEAVVGDTEEIMGFGKTTDYLVIFKKSSIYILHYVGGNYVFNIIKRVEGIGCYAPDSIMVSNNFVYFFGANKRIYAFDGIEAKDISAGIQDTLSNIKDENFGLIYGLTLETLNKIVWLIPEGDVDVCNKMLILDISTGVWFKFDIGGTVLAIGGYTLESAETWDTYIAMPEVLWETIDPDLQWRSINYAIGERIQVIGDNAGNTYKLFASLQDKGTDFEGVFITRKIECKNANVMKRFLLLQHYFKNEGLEREVTISVRAGNEKNFVCEDTFTIGNDTDDEFIILNHYIDCTGKSLQIKITSNDFFQYMGSLIYYNDVGLR